MDLIPKNFLSDLFQLNYNSASLFAMTYVCVCVMGLNDRRMNMRRSGRQRT